MLGLGLLSDKSSLCNPTPPGRLTQIVIFPTTLLDDNLPLGEFLDEQLTRAKDIENAEADDISETAEIIETGNFETPIRPSTPRYELPVIPEGYVIYGWIGS